MSSQTGHSTLLHTSRLAVGFGKSRRKPTSRLLSQLNLQLARGELACLLGPNGCGKSTLIRSLAGLHPVLEGQVSICGRALQQFSRVDLARSLSVVLTQRVNAGNLTVFELVSLGRYPYADWRGQMSREDERMVEWAIGKVGIEHLIYRNIQELSDGERQKSMLARALAQNTPLILMDEPTAHLDVTNRISMLSLLRSLAAETGKAVLLSTHELDMALQVADTIWLVDRGQHLRCAAPEDLALDGSLDVFAENGRVYFDRHSGSFRIQHRQDGQKIGLHGEGPVSSWTRLALEKEGFQVYTGGSSMAIQVEVDRYPAGWTVRMDGQRYSATSIQELKHILDHGEKSG